MPPSVSVVIPTFNRAHCIMDALESVFAQTYRDYEIVVIDDGSCDGTRELLEPYFDRIRYVYQENKGLAAARNRGLTEARGEWIGYLDSDDTWEPAKLEIQTNALANSPDLIAHVTNAMIFREHLAEERELFGLTGFVPSEGESSTRLDRPLVRCLRNGLAWMQCLLIRRVTMQRVGGFRATLKFYMDYEFGCRLALAGAWEVCHVPQVRILRKDSGEVESMSSVCGTMEGRTELVEMYSLVSRMPGLTTEETHVARRKLSDARADLALRHIVTGGGGRRELVQAFREFPRLGSLAKMGISILPAGAKTFAARKILRMG